MGQVKYVRKTLREKKDIDEVATLIHKSETMPDFIHGLQFTPNKRFVVVGEQTLKEVTLFCTNPENITPFCIDTTYGVGNFFVTPTCYKHLRLLSRATNEHPTLPGPALFHVEQDEKVFHYFAQTLIKLKQEFANTLFLGSDRDKALVNGFTRPLPFVSSLFCKKHVVDDINRKMSEDLGYIPLSERKEILAHIFGCEKRKEKGLIDAVSEEEFDRKLLVLSRKWDNLEMSMRNEPPQFSACFRKFIAEDMKKDMILAVRQAAGLNDNFFFNNTSESTNFHYKNKIKQFKAKSQHSGKPDTKCT